MRHYSHSSLSIVHSALCIAVALAAASATATPGWSVVTISAGNPYEDYRNILRGRQPYIFTNNNANAAVSTAKILTDGRISVNTNNDQYTRRIYKNSSLFYKLCDDSAGVNLKNIRITTCWNGSERSQLRIGKMYVKTVAGGDSWIELPDSTVASAYSAKGYQGTYADSEGAVIAEGATDLWIYFGTAQGNTRGDAGYTEIEAEATSDEDVYLNLSTSYPAGCGSLAVSPASADGEGNYLLDTEVTLTATPAAGYTFHSWYGNVPAGHAFDNPLTVPMSDDRTIRPIFIGDWQWSGNVMTDGYWRVTTSVSGQSMTITAVSSDYASPILDFRKPIHGTDARPVSLNNNVLASKATVRELYFPDTLTSIGESGCRTMTALTNCVLSANLVTIGATAFYDDSALRHLTPLLPDTLTTLVSGENFRNVPLSGKLVISNRNLTSIPRYAFYFSSGLTEVDLSRSGVTSIGECAFRSASRCTAFWLPPTLTSVGADVFYDTPKTSVYFQSLPSFVAKSFEGIGDNSRIVIFKDDQDWLDYLSSSSTFTSWTNLSASVRNSYTFTDNCKPYGRVTIGANGKAVFVATRSRPNAPLRIMVQ